MNDPKLDAAHKFHTKKKWSLVINFDVLVNEIYIERNTKHRLDISMVHV